MGNGKFKCEYAGWMDAWLGWDAMYAVIERQRGSERALYPLEG